jgi:hypothetical protein
VKKNITLVENTSEIFKAQQLAIGFCWRKNAHACYAIFACCWKGRRRFPPS